MAVKAFWIQIEVAIVGVQGAAWRVFLEDHVEQKGTVCRTYPNLRRGLDDVKPLGCVTRCSFLTDA